MAAIPRKDSSRRQWDVLRTEPDFRRLWAGQTVSSLGSAITTLALPLTAVVALKATPAQMGILRAAGFLPHLLFGLVAGVWVDRLRRRPVLILADLRRALLLGSVPGMALLGALRMACLYGVAFLTGVLGLFFDVAANSYVPSLVGRERLARANSATVLSGSVASAVGPALAGALVQALTAPVAIALDALSFLIFATFTLLIRAPEAAPAARQGRGHLCAEIGEGLRVLVDHPVVRPIAASAVIGSIAGQVQASILVLYLVRELRMPLSLLGTVFATSGVASVLGALLAGPITARHGPGPAYLAGTFVTFGAIPLGSLLGGGLGQVIGLRATLLIGGLGMLLGFLWAARSPVRSLRAATPPLR